MIGTIDCPVGVAYKADESVKLNDHHIACKMETIYYNFFVKMLKTSMMSLNVEAPWKLSSP